MSYDDELDEEAMMVSAANLDLFIQAAVELAESLREDLKKKGYASDITASLLKHFDEAHMNLFDAVESHGELH